MNKKETTELNISEIKLKKAEVLLKEKEAELKNLEVVEKAIDIDEKRLKDKNIKTEIQMDKIRLLSNILTHCQIDDDSPIIGSEMKFKHIFNENEKESIKNKLFEIINKL